MRFILSPLIIAAGVIMMKYAVPIANFTGMVDFAEKYMTGGLAGTYSLYKLIGFALCILGLAYLFGLFNFIPTTLPDPSSSPAETYLQIKNYLL
jgi:hypothetical protein